MGNKKVSLSIVRNFETVTDPRILLKTTHKLVEVIAIAICAVICGADKWTQVEEYGKANQGWLKTILELPNGIPSHDTFGRIFSKLDPMVFQMVFQRCFQTWIREVFEITGGQVIAIDGKTLRRSHHKKSNKSAIHMVYAWAAENSILLGQIKTEEKSNEITAIPELLDMLAIKGCIITIDAMGCQSKIQEKEADYILAVKDNQGSLRKALSKV